MGVCGLFVHRPKQLFPVVLQANVIYVTVESYYTSILSYLVHRRNSRVPLSEKSHSVAPTD